MSWSIESERDFLTRLGGWGDGKTVRNRRELLKNYIRVMARREIPWGWTEKTPLTLKTENATKAYWAEWKRQRAEVIDIARAMLF